MRILGYWLVCSVFQRPGSCRAKHTRNFILTTHGTMIIIATPKIVLLPNVDQELIFFCVAYQRWRLLRWKIHYEPVLIGYGMH